MTDSRAEGKGAQPPRPHHDAGLQPERTVLAWTRTTVSFLVASGILLKWTPQFGWPVLVVVGVLAAVALLILARQRLRYARSARGISKGSAFANVRAVAATTACLLGIGVAEIVFTLVR